MDCEQGEMLSRNEKNDRNQGETGILFEASAATEKKKHGELQ